MFVILAQTSQQNINIKVLSKEVRVYGLKIYSVEIIISHKIKINSRITKIF